MKKILYLISLFIIANEGLCQIAPMGCVVLDTISTGHRSSNCSMSSAAFDNYEDFYNSSLSMWNPNTNDNTKIIKVNFIVLQKSAGNGGPANFSSTGVCPGGGMTDEEFLNALITNVNSLYANFQDPSDNGAYYVCGSCNQIKNSKIQFELQGIHYYVDDTYYNTTTIAHSYNPDSEVNVYLQDLTLNYDWATMPSYNLSNTQHVFLNRVYADYLINCNDALYGHTAMLAHELGHILGLCHTHLGGGCPTSCLNMYNSGYYFDDVFGSYSGTCPDLGNWLSDPYASPTDGITNNLMGNTLVRRYLSPKQIAAMHRNLAFKSVRKYLKTCTYNANNTLVVSTNEDWDFDIFLDRDIKIETGNTLTLKCKLSMPDGATITVDSGATLIIDEDAILQGSCQDDWEGWIHVKENATLIIKNGGTIRMSGNGNILIDYANGYAGLLEYEEGANIIFDSYNTKLEVKGNLYIDDNANFSIQGKGYILFNSPLSDGSCYNISSGTNTSFTLQGENQNHKKLEIAQPSLYMHEVKNVSISDAKVIMTGNTSRLSLNYASGGSISIDNILITTSTGNKTSHRGIALYGQSNISIENSVFRNGMYGIHAMLNYTDGAPLTLTNCAFYNNDRGLNVNDKGITLSYCTFDGNGYGVYADGMTFSSESNYSSYIYSTNDGINYTSASTGGLYVLYPLITNNSNNGIAYSGATKLSVRCGDVRSNYKGITFSNNASLNMSQNETPIGGRVRMSVNTENNIYASNGNLLFLNSGYNNLQRNTNKMVISGNLGGYSACPTYLPAQYNRWNSSNSSPVYNTDYTLVHNGICREKKIYLTDNSPTYATCSTPPPLSAGDNSFASSTTINTQNYNNTTLPNAIADAVNLIGSNNYFTASDRLYEILNYPFLSTSAADHYYLNKAYLYMKENMAYILQDLVSDTTLTAQNTLANHVGKLKHIQNNIIAQTQNVTNAYNRYYYASLDKALLYRAIYDYDNALLHLNNILPWVKSANSNELNKWICLTQLEKDVLDSIVRKEEFFELKQLCENNVQLKIASNDSNDTLYNEEPEADNVVISVDEPYITVTPNPVTNQSLINVYVPNLKDDVVIRIFDVLGTLHKEIKINEIQSTIRINNSSFKDGVYQFVLSQGNTVLDNVRVVFVKD